MSKIFKILGGYSIEDHLFPFRTEKLSSIAQMVLHFAGEYVAAYLIQILITSVVRIFFCLFFIIYVQSLQAC